ncbi:F-box protein At4g00755-like [Oryza brachyantha]|uniref:F-box domain-containing protein n=1 Tax=Oryza brachyantha TaxID=4533 RepID=J3LV19_ORYBR|nr:F-box protein At4g00755-like [Oryza brachyantha]
MEPGQEEEAARFDFLEWLHPDTSATVFTFLDHPAHLARASAVSRSWRRFVVGNGFSKIQCLRLCPDVSNFTSVSATQPQVVNVELEAHHHHMAYVHLSHGLLSPSPHEDCTIRCIGASTTDNFPEETIQNTLYPIDRVDMMRPSYWSSAGHLDPAVPESLFYILRSDLCLLHQINIQPFKAFFQYGDPIYSSKYVRFRLGYPKTPLPSELLVSHENQGQLAADENYIWTYTSPQFPMLQENALQSFKLPRPVLCIGGVVKIELLGRVQKQAMDGLYYICISHVQIVGNPLPPELGVAPYKNGVALKYYPDTGRSSVCRDGRRSPPNKWRNFASRIWHSGPARGIGWNQAILSRLFGAHDAPEET